MESNHVLNQKLKRLEPKETLCRFCNQRHSDKMDRNYFAPLFKVIDRTELVVYRSAKFQKIEIGVPRCTHCYVIHKESSYNSWIVSLVSSALLAILGFVFLGYFGFFSFIGCFVLAFVSPSFISGILVKNKGIPTETDMVMKDPLIQELVIGGWSLNPPSV